MQNSFTDKTVTLEQNSLFLVISMSKANAINFWIVDIFWGVVVKLKSSFTEQDFETLLLAIILP